MPVSLDKSNATLSSNETKQEEDTVVEKKPADKEEEPETRESASGDALDSEEEEQVAVSSKDDEGELGEEADPAFEKEHAEILRRKRDREGSLEPSLSSQQGVTTPDTIPTKKNRLQDAVIGEEQSGSSSVVAPSSPNHKGVEGEKVGQIRKRVQDLSWKQRKEGDRDGEEEEPEEEKESLESEALPEAKSETKRTQPSFSSFSTKPSAFAAASNAKQGGDGFLSSPSSPPSTDKKPSSPTGAGRTQPTFSSFSKSSSPFNTASSVAGPSWLAGKSGSGGSTGSPGGGIKPSALGSVGSPNNSSGEAFVSTSSAVVEEEKSEPSTAPASVSKKQLGFGAFASSKTFGSRSSTPASSSEKAANGDESEESGSKGKSFDEVLKEGDEKGEGIEANKVSTQLDRGEADLRTGEENEKILTSARGKLYTMSEDKNWKERGTGTVRCNVAKEEGGAGRLVMRSEGVLRLILNINLFKGMKINLEQDKFLRIVALEDGKLAHFAIKFANPATAGNFYHIVKQTIPAEDGEEHA